MEDTKDQNNQSENSFSKTEFDSFVKNALSQIKNINEAYKKFFESEDGKESIISEIEIRLEDIKQQYNNLFVNNESGVSKISELNSKLDDIRNYHKQLLEGNDSIRSDIKESQDKITDFYVYLFGGSDSAEGQENKIKAAIEEIINFHTDLTKEYGYISVIKNAHTEITESHNNLYLKDEQGDNMVSKLNKDIERIKAFRGSIENDIEPFLKEIKDDIISKRKDVNALLVGSSGGSLVEGFLKSKKEYRQEPEYKKLDGLFNDKLKTSFSNISAFVINFIPWIVDYILFIFPLIMSVIIFVRPDLVSLVVGSKVESAVPGYLNGLNFYGRLIISLPLWWISWFGQRSISHKRRIAEEYNHKAQVTTMYLNFSSRETQGSYPISKEAREQLDKELINVIARHPGQVYGKDETIIDKIIQAVKAGRGINDSVNEDKIENKIITSRL